MLIIAKAIADIGDWAERIAIFSLMYNISGTPVSMSLISVANILPRILFSSFAGQFVDEHNKKKIIIIGDYIRAVLVLSAIFFKEWVFIILFFISIADTFTDIAHSAIVPFVCQEVEVNHINAVKETVASFIMVLGPTISGLMVSFLGIEFCFILDSLAFAISPFLLFKVNYRPLENGKPKIKSSKSEIRKTLAYIKSVPILYAVNSSICAMCISAGALNSLFMIFVFEQLKQDSVGYGILVSSKGVAMAVGAIIFYKLMENISCERVFSLSILGLGLVLTVFPLNRNFILAIIIQVVNGIFNVGYSIAKSSIMQLKTDKQMLGKVLSLISLSSNVILIVFTGFWGIAANYIGVTNILFVCGLIVLCSGLYSCIITSKNHKNK